LFANVIKRLNSLLLAPGLEYGNGKLVAIYITLRSECR